MDCAEPVDGFGGGLSVEGALLDVAATFARSPIPEF